jgi:ComF family protein
VESGRCCPGCSRDPPAFQAARSLVAYEGPVRAAICALKYRRHRLVADSLGRLLAELAPLEVTRGASAVVPVPLHPSRQAERGFNQAELLARPVADSLGIPCLPALLCRIHQESPQAELDAAARRESVHAAFAPGALTPHGTVLLVDDVFSTGSTAAACARALKAAGAEQVLVLTLARTLLRQHRSGDPVLSPRY